MLRKAQGKYIYSMVLYRKKVRVLVDTHSSNLCCFRVKCTYLH